MRQARFEEPMFVASQGKWVVICHMSPVCHSTNMDWIIVNDLSLHVPLGPSHWPKPGSERQRQPILVTAKASVSVAQAGASDALADSVNYSSLAKTIEAVFQQTENLPDSLESLARLATNASYDKFPRIDGMLIQVSKIRGLLHAKSVSYVLETTRARETVASRYHISELKVSAIIGIHPWERAEKQIVIVDLELEDRVGVHIHPSSFDYRSLVTEVSAVRCCLPNAYNLLVIEVVHPTVRH